ncbi:uncharacterized protein F5891DRAFT_1033767 [Suillus fuscotomentosus]|uniref:Uncharacterized protein n=1 Tax=Suillus fuscotomentosus TaxID=1912939 RepID=A0AAD4E5Z3_9AGAM|nr:uncharacterized protein F5891DRAFT_1033767 [Suillus fuscotomentosus]KAG1900355.1 hypothetical protein F5891DRAFT_1033767 [Suillus fuscotomentosus]
MLAPRSLTWSLYVSLFELQYAELNLSEMTLACLIHERLGLKFAVFDTEEACWSIQMICVGPTTSSTYLDGSHPPAFRNFHSTGCSHISQF